MRIDCILRVKRGNKLDLESRGLDYNSSSATDFACPVFNLFAYKLGILILVQSYEDKLRNYKRAF